MKRLLLIGLMIMCLFCSACSAKTQPVEQGELIRVHFNRGHGSTWGNQFQMDVGPSEVSYLQHFLRNDNGLEHRELYALPLDEAQWEQIETATRALLPMLQEQKPPSLLKRLAEAIGPVEVDGGAWWRLTLTWRNGDETQEIQYVWPYCEEAEALESLLEELAKVLDE